MARQTLPCRLSVGVERTTGWCIAVRITHLVARHGLKPLGGRICGQACGLAVPALMADAPQASSGT